MFKRARIIVVVALVLGLAADATQAQHRASPSGLSSTYFLDFSANVLAPTVRADLPVTSGRLFMAGWGADMHKRGWAHYIRNLRASEMNGTEITLGEIADSAVWRLADTTSRTIRLEYQVDLSHARSAWPYGNEQAATLQGEDLFTVSKALFIVSSTPGKRTVRFKVPGRWHVSTPWAPLPESAHSFTVDDNDSLIDNSLVVGPTAPTVTRAGGFTFLLAALGEAKSDRDRVGSALGSIVREYMRVFPQTPPSRYLMTLFRAPERDAEAYGASAAFSEPDSLTSSNRILWASTLAHELFHAWNGHAIRPVNYSNLQWFSEGFTDYYATRSLARARVIDESLFIRKAEHTIGLYLYFKAAPVFDSVTLVSAGERKGRNRLGVYNGGWVSAFCMDTQIRTASRGRRSLDDVMRLLYSRFGLTGRPYSLEDLRAAFAEASGTRFDEFLTRYVAGHETIPVAECLQLAGYQGAGAGYDGDYYVAPGPLAEYRRWLFGDAVK